MRGSLAGSTSEINYPVNVACRATSTARHSRPRTRHYPRRVHWFFTGLLIAASGGTAAYTLWLLRRLFTTAPVAPTPDAGPTEAAP
jgi:hypothetical protein